MNRLCPQEEKIAEYLSGISCEEEKIALEKHFTKCSRCRKLMVETFDLTKEAAIMIAFNKMIKIFKKNIFLFLSATSLVLSFYCNKYFLQFLTASILCGFKYIIDSKTTKTLIMINEAYKKNSSKNFSENLPTFKKQ